MGEAGGVEACEGAGDVGVEGAEADAEGVGDLLAGEGAVLQEGDGLLLTCGERETGTAAEGCGRVHGTRSGIEWAMGMTGP